MLIQSGDIINIKREINYDSSVIGKKGLIIEANGDIVKYLLITDKPNTANTNTGSLKLRSTCFNGINSSDEYLYVILDQVYITGEELQLCGHINNKEVFDTIIYNLNSYRSYAKMVHERTGIEAFTEIREKTFVKGLK